MQYILNIVVCYVLASFVIGILSAVFIFSTGIVIPNWIFFLIVTLVTSIFMWIWLKRE
jgi:hypothetical protein